MEVGDSEMGVPLTPPLQVHVACEALDRDAAQQGREDLLKDNQRL